MIHAKCKCGQKEFWGSGMSPAPCSPCTKCGTVPAIGGLYEEPLPHDYVAHRVDTDEGPKTLSRCRYCLRTRAQIESSGLLNTQTMKIG